MKTPEDEAFDELARKQGAWAKNQTLPQREWVGLTDEEIDYQAKKDDHGAYFALGALWASTKLKEKNG